MSSDSFSSSTSTPSYCTYSDCESPSYESSLSYQSDSSDDTVTSSDYSTGYCVYHSYGTPCYNNSGPRVDQLSPEEQRIMKYKEQITSLAVSLREEVFQFMEHQVKLNGIKEHSRLPIFYVKAFNYLMKMANEINYENDVLNSMPKFIKISMIMKYGPPSDIFPQMNENGLLVDNHQESLINGTDQLFTDITEYIQNGYKIDGFVPFLPKSYFITLKAFGQQHLQEKRTEEFVEEFNFLMAREMQISLTESLGESIVDKDFVNKCTRHFNNTLRSSSQFNNLVVDIN